MKMVKSLLLGSAAGLVALSGAQAADLPVKAKPVQYVKICSLYGAGFYYIPGTDTCLKVGGFVRAEMNFNANGSFGVPLNANYDVRTGTREITRTRIIMSFDARSQTEYGTLRSYGRGGWQWSSGDYQVGGSQGASSGVSAATATGAPLGSSSTTYFDRAFVQLAGFTAGKTQSFFDFFNAGLFSNQTPYLWMDTGGSGTPVFAYTATFGNGLSATISAEEYSEQALPIVNVNSAATVPAGGITPTAGLSNTATDVGSNHANDGLPDIVANLRADQAWGSAQIQGALHDNRATYYTGATNVAFGSPADSWGYALGGGVQINIPQLGKGDVISAAANYCVGASRYCSNPNGGIRGAGNLYAITSGNTVGFGNLDDAYYGSTSGTTGSNLQLPTAFNVEGGIAHHWNDKWQSSLYGGYLSYKANSTVVDAWCTSGGGAGVGAGVVLAPGCRDFSAWQVGSRLLWNPVPNLDISLEALYHHINGAMAGLTVAGATGSGAGSRRVDLRQSQRVVAASSACKGTSIPDRLIKVG